MRLKHFVSVLLMLLAMSIGQVWAETYSVTFKTAASDGSTCNTTVSSYVTETTYITSMTATRAYYNGKSGMKLGSSSDIGNAEFTLTDAGKVKASNISVVSATYDSGKTYKCTITYTDNTTVHQSQTFGSDLSWDLDNTKTISKIKFESVTKSKGRGYISSFTITYTPSSGDPVAVTGVSLNKDATSIEVGANETLIATIAPGDATNQNVSWASSNTNVATVDAGTVTAVAEGEATITVTTQDGTKTATCTVTVTPAPLKSSLIFNAACNGSGTADDNVAWIVTSDAAESTFDSSNGRGVHYGTGSKSVEYIELTSAAFTNKITKIEVEASGANTPSITATVGGETFGEAVNGLTNSNVKYTIQPTSAQSATNFTGAVVVRIAKTSAQNGALYCKSVVVYYEEVEATQVATPEISGTENFYPETTVSISCGTDGAAIYYTTDGTAPTSGSTLYSAPFTLDATKTVKAIAIKAGLDNSEMASQVFTLVEPLATMQAIFEAATTTETDQIITFSDSWVVTGISTNGKNAYITDGTKGMILFNNGASLQDPVGGLVVGNTLSGTVTRSLKLYNGASELVGFTVDGLTTGTAEEEPSVNNLDAEGIAALSAVNTGSLIKISGQCISENSKYYIKYGNGDNDKVQVYNTLYAFESMTANANYEVTGVYVQNNAIKEIAPRSNADIVQKVVKTQPETQWNATAKTVRMGDATTDWWSTASDGEKSFNSSNTEVATITNAGVITLVAPGTTTLTFSTAETGTYYVGNTSLTLTVKAALPTGASEFSWVAADWAAANEITENTTITSIDANSDISMTWNQNTGNAPAFNYKNVDVRLYRYNSVTFQSKNGKLLAGITLNFRTNSVKGSDMAANCGTYDPETGEWVGLSNSVTITNTGTANVQANMTSIEFVYLDGTVTTLSIANVAMKTTDAPLTIVPTCNVTPTPAISYEIATADQEYATIENGIITPHKVTETSNPISVTATIAEGVNYTAASTTFTIIVSEKQVPELSFPAASYNANLGSDFEEPALTTDPEGIAVTYSSSETSVATVDEATGVITLVGEGETVITAAFAGNGDYAANSAFYTLNVADPNKDVLTAAGIGKNSYENWSDKTFTSAVKYAGNNTTGTGTYAGTIQMRTSSNSGIVSTSTIGYLKSISATATKNGNNSLNIYAKNTAYESSADLYDNDKRGTLIGTISKDGGAMVFEEGKAYSDNYKYIGIKANGGAVYYDDIIIKWEPAVFTTYSVTYEAGDATGDDVVIDNIEDGTPITLQDNPYTYEGHVFAGWSDGVNVYEEGDDYTVNGNVTFTAQWAEQFNVTYNPGEAGGDAIVRTVAAGAYNLEAGSIFTYAGHAFDGWMKDETKYNAGASYPISENVAFTAQWVEAPDPVTVTFVAGTDKSETMSLIKDGISLSYEASSGTFNRDDDYRCYSGKTLTIASEVGNITNIAFTLTQNTFTTETGTYENGSWNGSAESIVFTTSGGQVRMTEIAVTYIPNGNTPKQAADLMYATTNYEITVGDEFNAPAVANPHKLTVTYAGNNNAVATVDATSGALTLTGAAGIIKVTAHSDGNDSYYAGEASYTLKVKEVSDNVNGTWRRVTEVEDGMKIIIAQHTSNASIATMGKDKGNNRYAISSSLSNNVLTPGDGTSVFTLVALGSNTFAIKTTSGKYLYAASSNNNNLKEEVAIDNNHNAEWTITIAQDGHASIIAAQSTNRNVVRYNSSGDGLFSCYEDETSQTAVAIYSKNVKVSGGETNASTLDEYADVVVENGATLVVEDANTTVLGEITVQSGATVTVKTTANTGDITVENGGVIDASASITANSLYIQADATGSSAQVINAANIALAAGGDVFFDLKLGAEGKRASQWHAFTVPFPVDAINGIFDKDDQKLTNEVNYAIMDYHGDVRAEGKYGWKKYRGILQPGVFYIMTVDGEREVYRFKKANNDAFAAPATSIAINAYGVTGSTDTNSDHGWNGVGNPNLVYGKINATVQVLDPDSYEFEDKDVDDAINFTVGTPFFYQAKDANPAALTISEGDNGTAYAPARYASNELKTRIYMSNDNYSSRLTVTANEEALNQYQLGEDLVKMTMTNTPRVPSITAQAYSMKLCRIYTPLANDKAEVALTLYAPETGEYTISAEKNANATVYLIKDGTVIWNLSTSDYTADFDKGNNAGYSIMIQARAPQIITDLENINALDGENGVQKLLIDGQIYILRNEKMYDVNGKMVK